MLTEEKILRAFKTRLNALVKHTQKTKGKTQEQIADGIGISKQALSLYLQKNKRMPQADNLLLIADYFKISVDNLLGRAKGKTADNEEISKRLGLTDDAIAALEKMNQPGEAVDEVLKLIDAPVIQTVNTLLSTDQGRHTLRDIACYLGGDFSRPFIEAQGSSAYDDDPKVVYPPHIFVKSSYGAIPISISGQALEESVLASITRGLHNLKRQEAKKHVNPEN